ncbi:AAA-like domain protein [compost metagenome]
MITQSSRLIRNWQKPKRKKDHLIVNTLQGTDTNTGHYVRVLMVKNYPPMILAGYLDQLDEMVAKEGACLRKTIRYAPSEIKFNNSMKNKLKRLNKNLEDVTDIDPARQAEVDTRETILALRDSATNANRKLVEISTFLTISAAKMVQLDAAQANLELWFDDMEASLDTLYKEQLEAMRQTSPASDLDIPSSEFFTKNHYGRVTTDSAAARTYPLTRGTFTENQGIYFGRRTEDGGWCFINLCDPDDPRAQNITVMGKTGEGKSFFMKALVVSLLDEGVHVFVFDLDGEWRYLCEAVGGSYFDQTSAEGKYFEPLAIMPKIPELDLDCINYNQSRLKLATDNGIRTYSLLGENLTRGEIFEVGEAIRRVYAAAGIKEEDPDTWEAPYSGPRPTIHLAFKEIEEAALKDEIPNAISLYDKIKIYFIGVYDHMFKVEEEFSVQRTPLVVYKVGNASAGKDKSEKAKQAQVKMSMAFDVVNANIQLLKFEGVSFSAVVVDEGQRQLLNPELRQSVFDWYTAIRKWNGMMILGSNTPAIMLDNSEGTGMWENTSVRVYFYMERSAVRTLVGSADVPIEIQDKISENEGSNCYILEYHKKYDELFMHVPESEAALYKTRGLKKTG